MNCFISLLVLAVLALRWVAVHKCSHCTQGQDVKRDSQNCIGKLEVDESLLGLPGVVVQVVPESRSNQVFLLNGEEVDDLPHQDKHVGGQALDHSWGQSGSRSGAVLSVPSNEEASSDEAWSEQDEGHSWFPPGHGGVCKLVVGIVELHESNEEDHQTDQNNTCLDWDAEAALNTLS